MKERSYKIEVDLFPANEFEPDKPYFWCLRSIAHTDTSDWCMENGNWSATPQEAWDDAYSYYQRFYENEADECKKSLQRL